jgi:hypothetical protein
VNLASRQAVGSALPNEFALQRRSSGGATQPFVPQRLLGGNNILTLDEAAGVLARRDVSEGDIPL